MKTRCWDDRKIALVGFPIFGATLGGLLIHFVFFNPTLLDYLYGISSCLFVGALGGVFVSRELTKMREEMTNQVK